MQCFQNLVSPLTAHSPLKTSLLLAISPFSSSMISAAGGSGGNLYLLRALNSPFYTMKIIRMMWLGVNQLLFKIYTYKVSNMIIVVIISCEFSGLILSLFYNYLFHMIFVTICKCSVYNNDSWLSKWKITQGRQLNC